MAMKYYRVTRSQQSLFHEKDNLFQSPPKLAMPQITPQKKISTSQKRKLSSSTPLHVSTPDSKTNGNGKVEATPKQRVQDIKKAFTEHELTEVYKAIRKRTGMVGGYGSGGAIYGEITMRSFQKIIDYMKEHCDLNHSSLFLDIGSGLGKPNFHAAVDPIVEVSYGVELEPLRWQLSLLNLQGVMACKVRKDKLNNVIFTQGDITHAKTLNPFTHVYSFDVGFPPFVMESLAGIFNGSSGNFMASFHPPKKIIEHYGFQVESMDRIQTNMAGSSEGHTCYFYRRKQFNTSVSRQVDQLFSEGFKILQGGNEVVDMWVHSFLDDEMNSGRTRRQKRKNRESKKELEKKAAAQFTKPLETYYPVVSKKQKLNS